MNNKISVAKQAMSKTRKVYFARLVGRCIALIVAVLLYMFNEECFEVLEGWNFFKSFSILHIMWVIWLADMIMQLTPIKAHISIGSQKLFLSRFRPVKENLNYQKFKNHIVSTTKSAYKVFVLWCLLAVAIGILYKSGTIDAKVMFVISVFFYVADLICVLIWCPFRLIMGNKCCTTCRIFNWDHLMMFSPFMFVAGFYTQSLFLLSLVIWLIWELWAIMYPERFYEITNVALRCSECTDKLCTQYCRKLRKNKQ